MSIPTPQIGHFTVADYEHFYEPAEDSFILLDALEADAELIRSLRPALSVEIGPGSGVVSAFISAALGDVKTAQIATDINPFACAATLRTAEANDTTVDVIRADLLDPLLDRLKGQVDLLVFNPPYVPTDDDELHVTQKDQGIGGAWAGGLAGMAVTDQVLRVVPSLLSASGRFYLVTIEQNNPKQVIDQYKGRLHGSIVLRRRAGRELLSVLCFTLSHA